MNDKLNRKIYAEEIAEEISDKYDAEKELARKDQKCKKGDVLKLIESYEPK